MSGRGGVANDERELDSVVAPRQRTLWKHARAHRRTSWSRIADKTVKKGFEEDESGQRRAGLYLIKQYHDPSLTNNRQVFLGYAERNATLPLRPPRPFLMEHAEMMSYPTLPLSPEQG